MQERRISPLDFQKDTAVGFALPLTSKTGGGFTLNYETFNQAKDNLRNLLFTEKGERYMQPEFGTGLKKYLFEMNDSEIEENIDSEIKRSVNFWLPYISVDEIKFDRYEYTIKIEVKFSLQGDEFSKDSITLTINTPEI